MVARYSPILRVSRPACTVCMSSQHVPTAPPEVRSEMRGLGQMTEIMNEKPQVVRSPEPRLGARETEERRRVAEIAREVEELGRALENRDRLRSLDKS